MKPNPRPKRTTLSEKIYSAMVHLYPFPFREEFGREMKQVFREQARETAERSGKLSVLFLWLRVIADFAWTCPKEHFLAIPSLPKRTWEHVMRKPTWIYPSLLATSWLLLTVIVTYSLTQVYSSSVKILVRKAPVVEPQGFMSDPFYLQTEFQKITSKASLYPAIEAIRLGEVYRERLGLDREPTIQETYKFLHSQIRVSQQRNTELIEVKVYDEDRELAKTLANAIVTNYRKWKLNSAHQAVLQQYGISSNESSTPDKNAPPTLGKAQSQKLDEDLAYVGRLITIVKPAELGLYAVQPNRELHIAVGILIAGLIGLISYFGLRAAKRKRLKSVAAAATLASA
jgi:capsular polysaccharide biosynthesis protein